MNAPQNELSFRKKRPLVGGRLCAAAAAVLAVLLALCPWSFGQLERQPHALTTRPDFRPQGPDCFPASQTRGAVYAMTNEADGNRIAIYSRFANGRLRLSGYASTGGLGSGGDAPLEAVDALGSQNPLILSRDQRWLFAVNAGSDEISVFRVLDEGLELTDKVGSGGTFPVSLTFDGRVLYVLNSGREANIFGFQFSENGTLTPLEGSARTLGVAGPDLPFFLVSPAQIGFSPLGDFLLVTVKGTNTIHIFSVGDDRLATEKPTITVSEGLLPFGFVFDPQGRLIVVEPFGRRQLGEANASAASSYELTSEGAARALSASVENQQTASCWIAATPNGRFVYATNNASDTVTGYRVEPDGRLSLMDPDGVTSRSGHAPVDLAVTPDGRFLYNVNAGDGTVGLFAINSDGSLTPLGRIGGLPVADGAVGIAAR